MLRSVIVLLVTLVAMNLLQPWLQRLGLGRLPGDLRFKVRGREWSLPIASAVLFTLVATLIGRFI
jgi:Protein of unknown function (DUF2905)